MRFVTVVTVKCNFLIIFIISIFYVFIKSKNIEYKGLTVTVTNRYRQYLQGFQDIFCQFSTVTKPIPRKGQVKVMNNKKLTARRYLEQIQEFDIYINQDLERLEEMKINACSTGAIDYSKDRVQTSPSGDTLCKQVTNYVAFNDKINAEIDSFADAKEQIIKEIRGLRDKNYVQVLYKVYVQYKTVKQASKEMKKCYNYTVELHNKALTAFEKTYQNLHCLM